MRRLVAPWVGIGVAAPLITGRACWGIAVTECPRRVVKRTDTGPPGGHREVAVDHIARALRVLAEHQSGFCHRCRRRRCVPRSDAHGWLIAQGIDPTRPA